MGRVVCSQCKHEIDDLALTCPLCGARTAEGHAFLAERKQKQRGNQIMFLIFTLMIGAMAWMIWKMLSERAGNASPPPAMDPLTQP